MNVKEIIIHDLPNFSGICVQEGVPINTAKKLGVTLSWKIKGNGIHRALKYKKIIVVGNNNHDKKVFHKSYNDEKGYYFIAQITDIVSMPEFLQQTEGMANENVRNHHNWLTYPIKTWDLERYIIFFNNSSEIEVFSTIDFGLMQNPLFYIR